MSREDEISAALRGPEPTRNYMTFKVFAAAAFIAIGSSIALRTRFSNQK